MALNSGRTGRYVPEFDWRVALAEYTFRLFEWLWCWRELSLPGARRACGLRDRESRPGLHGRRADRVRRPVAPARPPDDSRGVQRRCRMRSRVLSRQLSWPRVCRELGWARRLDKSGWLVPELVSWNENEKQVAVQVRPLPEHAAGAWDQMG